MCGASVFVEPELASVVRINAQTMDTRMVLPPLTLKIGSRTRKFCSWDASKLAEGIRRPCILDPYLIPYSAHDDLDRSRDNRGQVLEIRAKDLARGRYEVFPWSPHIIKLVDY